MESGNHGSVRDDYRQLQLGHTYYYRVTAKNERSFGPSNVISVQHSEENQPPVVTLNRP